jgi:hypothetical protein
MKVIFLDHDGVICLSSEWGGRRKKQEKWDGRKLSMSMGDFPLEYRFDNFNQKAIKILNKILEEMGEYYESQGIIKKPIDLTPNLGQCNWYNDMVWIWSPRWDLEMTRVIEIKQYLHDHPEITHWVAVDDLDMGKNGEDWKDWGLDNFVLTPRGHEGIKQSGIKDKILKFLK